MSRLTATLTIMGALIIIIVAVIFLTAPIIVREIVGFFDDFPLFIGRLLALAVDPSRPWLQKLVGDGLGTAIYGRIDDTGGGVAGRLRQ